MRKDHRKPDTPATNSRQMFQNIYSRLIFRCSFLISLGVTPIDRYDFKSQLLSWYTQNKRDLPFRDTGDAYKIWLSEIMLQQTTVATVIDYYTRFVSYFPNVLAVAKADEDQLLNLWQGLGYYSRIRNFKKACDYISRELDGKIPQSAAALKELPGVGDYTAAAIASIAYGEAVATIDGNVKRVIARLFCYKKEITSREATEFFNQKAAELLDKKAPGDFNQAMMELGATVCMPKNPKCQTCPVGEFCESRGKNPESLPVKAKTKYIDTHYKALVVKTTDGLLLKRPSSTSLIKNMWEIPCLYQSEAIGDMIAKAFKTKTSETLQITALGSVRHAITNKRITTAIFATNPNQRLIKRLNKKDFEFVAFDDLSRLTLNTLSKKILKHIDKTAP